MLILTALMLSLLVTDTPKVRANNTIVTAEEPPGLSSPLSRGLQKVFGINRIFSLVAERQLEKEIRKKVDGDIEVELTPYSGFDLMEGKAKRLNLKGSNLIYDNAFYVSEFRLETDEKTPLWVDLDNGKLNTPVNADISIRVTENDLNRSFETAPLKKQMESIKVPLLGAGTQIIRLVQPKVAFKPERLQFKTLFGVKETPEEKMLPLEIETGLELQADKGSIRFKDLSIAPIPGLPDLGFAEGILEDLLQRLLRPSKLIPLDGGNLEISSLVIHWDGLSIKGQVRLVPKAPSQT